MKSQPFQVVAAKLCVSVPPIFSNKPVDGVKELLDSLLMRYVPAFEGVLLAHSSLSFLDPTNTAMIVNECPWMVCNIGFDAMVWRPTIGMKLSGKISLSSPDHISLLVHRTFNVSIPRHHIADGFEFHYGPLENDPEYGPNAPSKEGDGEAQSTGRWVHNLTADPLGGEDGQLMFTVIGLTVANEMLSLIGSLQREPFDPSHVLSTSQPAAEEDDLDSIIQEISQHPEGNHSEDEEILDDGEDTFATLGRGADEMKAKASAAKPDTRSTKRKPLEELASSKKKKKKKAEEDGTKKKKKKFKAEKNG